MSENGKTPVPQAVAQILDDLAVLSDGEGVDLHVSFERGSITIRSQDRIVWSSRSERAWAVVDGHARAYCLIKWLHDVAERCREHERVRMAAMEEAA